MEGVSPSDGVARAGALLQSALQRSLASTVAHKLFLISFLALFLELVIIRWLSAYILYLGYFTNFVLLGALLGIGAGAILPRSRSSLARLFPSVLFGLLTFTLFTQAQVNPQFEGILYFTSTQRAIRLPATVILPLVFVLVSLVFTILGQRLGRLMTEFEPLRAYSINILGSLAGIACFTVMSLLGSPSWIWFLVAVVVFLPFLPHDKHFGPNLILLFGSVAIVAASDLAFRNIWSPYYRLTLMESSSDRYRPVGRNSQKVPKGSYVLFANGAGHQDFTTVGASRPFYRFVYQNLPQEHEIDRTLIVGAGGGNDVAVALANGVGHIDAVEIDPGIVQLGRRFHPESPYADPRVEVHINDARSFMESAAGEYDLIVFALPDSLSLATNMSSIRLESYLFTREAFESVRRLLSPDGLFVLYNYYRTEWLVDKIALMAWEVFEQQPSVHSYADPELKELVFATIFAGPLTSELLLTAPADTNAVATELAPATDDWPFLYLPEPSLPLHYTLTLGLMLLYSLFYVSRVSPESQLSARQFPFFLMGAAFMLLETKNIVQFFLLFGSTWLVNALVFFAILSAVLIANWIASKWKLRRLGWLYLPLLGSLAANFLLPLKEIQVPSAYLRYALATTLMFSPIFIANLIYSNMFRETRQANVALGANLLGTMLGGALEYTAMLLGYHNLILFAAAFYFAAFYMLTRGTTGKLAPV